ncbi:hypothetical protein ACFPYI_00835 [Halomarina salina]|uniref:Glycosyltransferase RgtA/B/C/D-like domain-containing protein n=1 Tax=Halomarina salina TaxID=1872699 RepID=A0ABD5RHU7_9EURY|nr:hypothetical protein [Halomarina salina]
MAGFEAGHRSGRWSRVQHEYAYTAQSLLLGLAALLLIVECVFFLTVPAATGFETSVVEGFPLGFWLGFYGTLAIGIVVLLLSAMTGSGSWRQAIGLVLANYALFLFLPVAKGYKLYGRGQADALRHLGDVKAMVSTGALPGVWYPADHILAAQLHLMGLPLTSVKSALAFVFTAILIVSVGMLVRSLTGSVVGTACGLLAAVPFVYTTFHVSMHPAIHSFMLLPAIVFVVERYRRTNDTVYLGLFVLFGITMVYFHPMTSILLVVFLLGTSVVTWLYGLVVGEPTRVLSPRLALTIPPMSFVWLINFRKMRDAVARVAAASDGSTAAGAELGQAASASFSPLQLFTRFMHVYGAIFVFLVVAGLFALFILYRVLQRDVPYAEALTAAHFGAGFGIAAVFLVAQLIAKGPIRVSRYMILMATLLVAILLVRWIDGGRRVLPVLLAGFVVLAAVLGANAAYEPNKHLTYSEYEGAQFLASSNDESIPVRSQSTSNKMEEFVLGSDHPKLWPKTLIAGNGVPPALGYAENETAAQTFGRSYVVTKAYDTEYYTASYFTEQQQRQLFLYDETHVERLRNDPTASKIYENGGYAVWLVDERPAETENAPNGTATGTNAVTTAPDRPSTRTRS